MNTGILMEVGTALLIALGFAGIGRLVLAPKSWSAFAWNDSFLVGAGVSAAALYPLSVAFPHSALWIIWIATLLGACVPVLLTLRRLISRERVSTQPGNNTQRFERIDSIGRIVLALIVLSSLCFATLNARWRYGWDGLQIWATKAQVLFFQGALSPEPQLWLDAEYLGRNATYPPLIPLYEALMSIPHRQFEFDVSKSIFLLFYVSLLLSTYRMARTMTGVRLGFVATALVSWLPVVSTGDSIGGYADLPLACFVAAVAANLVDNAAESGWRSPAPWLIGSLLMVKDEGLILLPVICFVVFCTSLSRPLSAVWKRINENWKSIAVVALLLLLRVGYLRWLAYDDPTYRPVNWPNLLLAMTLVGRVVRLSVEHLLSFHQFGIFWPAFLLFGGVLLIKGSPREKGLVAGTTLAIMAYTSTFLFTKWDIATQITQAYDRLLTQLVPVAAVCIVAGYHFARSALTAKEPGGVENPHG